MILVSCRSYIQFSLYLCIFTDLFLCWPVREVLLYSCWYLRHRRDIYMLEISFKIATTDTGCLYLTQR